MKLDKRKVLLAATVEFGDLVEQLDEVLDDDEMHAIIVELDRRRQDWEFTLKLADYFSGQRALYNAEVAEPGDEP